ncbi:MAG TPA: hypothetical protein VM680_19425 [Verrucomicrobiae bacterium]|nr:hypothetical protein [Verrucomicrobiae bacterium]
MLLPLSFGTFFIALSAAASFFPQGYDWRVHVISKLTSPVDNPEAYWIANVGIMMTMIFALPFAGYVQRRLLPITPRIASVAGVTFALGFIVMAISMLAQLAEPLIGLHKLHTYLAQTAAVFFMVGMICCSASAIRDRVRALGGRAALPTPLASFWAGLTLVPIAVLTTILLLLVLGGPAEEIRQSFRHTPMWHLAFWEWIGTLLACAFLTGSVALLPIPREQPRSPRNVTVLSTEKTPVSSL